MVTPDDVTAMVRLFELGWGVKRIARELHISKNTVKRYVRAGGYVPYQKPTRARALDDHKAWLKERFLRHRGNADVVRQELICEKEIHVSLRTVERAVAPYRQELRAEAQATVRFETPPGKQLQVDFGTATILIGGVPTKVELCVLTLGYSRRTFVRAFGCQRLAQWLEALEDAFAYFGGVPRELLIDNAKALITSHDVANDHVVFSSGFEDFCRHWGVAARACAPYRARTKGKDERMVGYVKGNAIAGRHFDSFSALQAHLQRWMGEVADQRIHATLRERPIVLFEESEQQALRPLQDRPRYMARRQLRRKVKTDATVEVDTNHYSVPWRHLGRHVEVVVTVDEVAIWLQGEELACHPRRHGRGERAIESAHLDGVVRGRQDLIDRARAKAHDEAGVRAETMAGYSLLRPLREYEELIGGGL